MALAGGYTGGSKGKRSLAGWSKQRGTTADAALIPALEEMRDNSRDLVRNAPLAAGALSTAVTNIVGTGLMLQSQVDRDVLGMSEEEAAAWQQGTEREFALWAENPDLCDITRTQDFYELQELALRGTLESGDIFYLTPYHKHSPRDPYGLKLQAVEGDRVRSKLGDSVTERVVAGVEMDERGAPVAYHIAREAPGRLWRLATEVDRIAAFGPKSGRRQVLHLFRRKRPGQTRGEPWFAPVIEPLKQLDRYTEAEISAAVVSSFFAVFVKSPSGAGLTPFDSATTGVTPGSTTDGATSGWNGSLSSGLVVDLAEGESIETANPVRPNTAFDPFVQAVLRQIGAGLELPFEVLIKHFDSSYSAARAAILEAWRFYRGRRVWLAAKFCQPVYELFLEEAISAGRISAPGFFDDLRYRAAYSNALWHGDGPGSIDPTKEIEAAKARIDLGVSTLKKETAEYDGSDWAKNHEQRVKERAARVAGDLEPPLQPPAASAPRTEPPADAPDAPDRT